MLNRTSLLTFAAVATLALTALAPATAFAKSSNHGGHGGGNHGGGLHISMKGNGGHHFRDNHWRFRYVRWHRHYRFHYVTRVLPVYNTYSTYSVARPAAPTCTCLTKTYLENGAVLFQDVCTKESAINQPADEQAQTR